MIVNDRFYTRVSENAYCDLAGAIVVQAAKDYREARRCFYKNPANLQARLNMKDVEHFFNSQWYESLTALDGNALLKRLKEEIA